MGLYSQSFLTKIVVGALGSIFELNASQVESNLIRKTRVSLRNLRLKPRVIIQKKKYLVELNGTIESCVFKWKWHMRGRHDDVGYMKKCNLTLSGVKLTLKTREREDSKEDDKEKEELEEKEESATDILNEENNDMVEQKDKNWKDKFVRKILDQLGLHLEDFELSIHLPWDEDSRREEIIVVTGESIALESLGRANHIMSNTMKLKNKIQKKMFKKEAPLLQKFEVGSIAAKVVIGDRHGNTRSLPLLSPFQYSTSIKQFHGKRFGSFSTGLDIVGKPSQRTRTTVPLKLKSVDEKSTFDTRTMQSLDEERDPTEDKTQTAVPLKLKSVNEKSTFDTRATESLDEERDPTESNSTQVSTSISGVEERVPAVDIDAVEGEIEMHLGYLQSFSSECISLSFADTWNEELEDRTPSDTLRIHLHEKQTHAIFNLLLLFKRDSDKPTESTDDSNVREIFQRPGGLASFKTQANKNNIGMRNLGDITSKFNLDFSSVQVALPNESTVVLNQCRVKIKGDASLSMIDGVGGAVVDGVQTLDPGCTVSLDILKRTITVLDDFKEANVPIEARIHEVKNVALGVVRLINLYKVANGITIPSHPQPPPLASSNNRWSVQVKSPVSLSL